MEVFALMGAWDYEGAILLGVYASEEEARNAHGVYTHDGHPGYIPGMIDHYFIEQRVLGAPVDPDPIQIFI